MDATPCPDAECVPTGRLKAYGRWRNLIETVGAQVTEPFAIARTRAHDLWQYQHRLIRKILAHTVLVFLNLQMEGVAHW
jgi:hypothetical protein